MSIKLTIALNQCPEWTKTDGQASLKNNTKANIKKAT